MGKTYNTFTNVSTGDVLTATNFNNIVTNVNNYRVPPAIFTTAVNTSQTLTNLATTQVQFNGVASTDTDAMAPVASDYSKFLVKTNGMYSVTASIRIASSAVTIILLQLALNGTVYYNIGTASAQTGAEARFSISGIIPAVANDYIQFGVYQESTANRTPAAATFGAVWLGQVS